MLKNDLHIMNNPMVLRLVMATKLGGAGTMSGVFQATKNHHGVNTW